MKIKIKILILYAILSSISFLLMMFEFPIFPLFPYLKYDLSDAIVIFSGFFFNPIAAIIIGSLKTLFFFISGKNFSGFIGLFIAFISTFVLILCIITPFYIAKKKISFLICSLIGTLFFALIMSFLNYFLLIKILGINKNICFSIILNVILPFNILKGIISSSIGILLFLNLKSRFKRFQ